MPARFAIRRAVTVVELTLACAIFSLIAVVMALVLRQISGLWQKANAKDEAVRNLIKARSSLQRDLSNSSGRAGRWAVAPVPAHLGTGRDSDALSFLSSDSGTNSPEWSTDSTGSATLPVQITYYGVIPNVVNPGGAVISAGPPDAQGYEQQHPFKWLIRRVDPAGGPPSTLNSAWTTWLTQPTSMALGPNQQVVANQLLQLRVIQGAPLWTLELRAVGVSDARRKVALGSVPLSQGPYTLCQRFSVHAQY